MPAHGQIIGILQLRRTPDLRDGGGVRIVDEGTGKGQMPGKYFYLQACAVQYGPIDHLRAVGIDQSLDRNADPQNLLIRQRELMNEGEDLFADLGEISLLIGIREIPDFPAQHPSVEVCGNELDPGAHDLHSDRHTKGLVDGIGSRLPANLVGIQIAAFQNHAHLFHLRQRRGYCGTTQLKGIGNILL